MATELTVKLRFVEDPDDADIPTEEDFEMAFQCDCLDIEIEEV